MSTQAERTRDRILADIGAILADAYVAPEVRRSQLYALVLRELDRFGVHLDGRIDAWLREHGKLTLEDLTSGRWQEFMGRSEP